VPQSEVDHELLYHYTDAKGLLGIFESGKLWSTEARYLNDATELDYAFGLLDEVLAETASDSSADVRNQLKLASSMNRELWRDDILCFVACFCQEKDLLNQWRGYAHGVGGYAIGFRRGEIEVSSVDRQFGPYEFRQVEYGSETMKAQLRDRLVDVLVRFRDSHPSSDGERLALWRSLVSSYLSQHGFDAPLVKSPGFKEEKEWRVVVRLPRTAFVKRDVLKSRVSPTLGLVPYVVLDVTTERQPRRPAVGQIVIGPTPHLELAERSLRDLLASVGYQDGEIVVEHSKVPLRA
jgi:hypothetical protein